MAVWNLLGVSCSYISHSQPEGKKDFVELSMNIIMLNFNKALFAMSNAIRRKHLVEGKFMLKKQNHSLYQSYKS